MDEILKQKLELISGYLKGTLHVDQEHELNEWINASADNRYLFESVTNPETLNQAVARYNAKKNRILRNIDPSPGFTHQNKSEWRPWRRRLALTGALAVVLTTASFLLFSRANTNLYASTATVLPGRFKNDVTPGDDQGKLILSDSTVIILLDSVNGELVREVANDVPVLKENGWLFYYTFDCYDSIFYNTLHVPLKGRHRVILPDGTRVWLNAGSSLTYPIMFRKHLRRVELTGEACFEVTGLPLSCKTPRNYAGRAALAASAPFVVAVQNESGVTDFTMSTGGSLDIRAYADEAAIEAISKEGTFVISQDKNYLKIRPGVLAKLDRKGQVYTKNDVAAEPRMAWKDDRIKFKDANIREILSQIARWYDVDIKYIDTNKAHYELTGSIDRNLPLSNALLYLETLCSVRFSIDDRQVTAKL